MSTATIFGLGWCAGIVTAAALLIGASMWVDRSLADGASVAEDLDS